MMLIQGCLLSHHQPLCSTSAEKEQLPVQCVDDPMELNAVIIYGDQEFPMPRLLQAEDKREGNDGEDTSI
ncbi:hypothetical protein PHYPO_G00058570 [Pangasianodon hypophthalmus]|uniref:Uncharacterized protein n=1 Tax=Pangasianodon hypophthalmus TaxID=310915 RepID=A0A5N5M1B2_PANHP|nr:hypothetical protein PHYPO_G00058570 [Pangasianodon hypophthalmus]